MGECEAIIFSGQAASFSRYFSHLLTFPRSNEKIIFMRNYMRVFVFVRSLFTNTAVQRVENELGFFIGGGTVLPKRELFGE